MIGLLATAGLRAARRCVFDRGDLDRCAGIPRVPESKFGKSRLVPLHPSALDALERYDHNRQRLPPDPNADGLFASLSRTLVI